MSTVFDYETGEQTITTMSNARQPPPNQLPPGSTNSYWSNSLAIRQEIQRFESVHPSIYAIYDLIESIPDPILGQQIRDHVVCIEGESNIHTSLFRDYCCYFSYCLYLVIERRFFVSYLYDCKFTMVCSVISMKNSLREKKEILFFFGLLRQWLEPFSRDMWFPLLLLTPSRSYSFVRFLRSTVERPQVSIPLFRPVTNVPLRWSREDYYREQRSVTPPTEA